jgi:hypothetical protein
MRPIFSALFVALTLASGPAAALGVTYDFPTLTWPITTPAPSVDLPTQSCVDPTSLTPTLCPAASR